MQLVENLLADLISFKSITPDDAGCQEYMINFFEQIGFTCHRFNNPPVANFFARYGNTSPLLVFAGHTDVVPVGDESKWHTDPFKLVNKKDMLYGRGAADMKGSLAVMMSMAERFIKDYPHFTGSLGFLITSGEEGEHFNQGTPYVMSELQKQGIKLDYCIVGEPSSSLSIGDVIKVGRRGSLNAQLTLHGKQGHVAYPHLADNAIHRLAPALAELTTLSWDEGNQFFPPTSLQVTQINAGGQANNIIPGEITLQFNFRFSPESNPASLQEKTLDCFKRHDLNPAITWQLSGNPFLTNGGKLRESCVTAINTITQQQPELSTSGGTSDGRFIAPYGVEVVELGPINATIHQVNEQVSLNDLKLLDEIYYLICQQLLT